MTKGKMLTMERKNGIKVLIGMFWILLMAIASITVLQISFITIIKLILFLLFGLLLPGYLIARNIIEKGCASEFYGFSILFGIGICIIEYFIDALNIIPGNPFCLYLGPVLSIPAIILLIKDCKSGRCERSSFVPRGSTLLIIAIAMIISFASMGLASGVPAQLTDHTGMYVDVSWNIGNIASLSHGWPTDTFQYLGKHLNSNIFALIFRVVEERFLGVTAAETMLIFSGFVFVPLIVFGLDAFALFVSGKNQKVATLTVFSYIFIGYLGRAVLYMYNIDWAYKVTYAAYLFNVHGLLYAPYGTDLAIPACALLLVLLHKVFDQGNRKITVMVAILLTAFILTGAKYVFTVCVAGGLVGTMLFQFIQNFKEAIKRVLRELICLVLIATGFLTAYYGVVTGGEVYELPAKSSVSRLDYEDPRYSEAIEEYISQLKEKKYKFVVVRSADDSDQVIVRQKKNGIYYIYGNNLQYKDTKDQEVYHNMRNGIIETGGILGGVGGIYHQEEIKNNLLAIKNAIGFFKSTDKDDHSIMYCFITYNTEKENFSFGKNPEKLPSSSELFVDGSDGTSADYSEAYSSITLNAAFKKTRIYRHIVSSNLFKVLTADIDTNNRTFMELFMLLLIPLSFFMIRPMTSIPFLNWAVDKFRHFQDIQTMEFILGGTAVCGLIGYYILSVNGLSQAYFLYCAMIIIDSTGVFWLYKHYKGYSGMIRKVLCVICVLAICSSMSYYLYKSRDGFRNISSTQVGFYQEDLSEAPGADYITRYEREAMEWVKKNTPEACVLATNRHYKITNKNRWCQPMPNDYDSRYYYYTAYSERQMFLGSWAYMTRTEIMQRMLRERLVVNDALFDPFCSNKREIMENNHIDYLVASAEVGTGMNMTDPDLICVFRNRDIAIYKLA